MIDPQLLRSHYTNLGMSRRGYADKLGINEQSLRRLEAGLGVHPATAKTIADDMGLQVTDFISVDRQAA